MRIAVSVDICLEEVESLVQVLETEADDALKGFAEKVLLKVHEKSLLAGKDGEDFEKINPFCMCRSMKEKQ